MITIAAATHNYSLADLQANQPLELIDLWRNHVTERAVGLRKNVAHKQAVNRSRGNSLDLFAGVF